MSHTPKKYDDCLEKQAKGGMIPPPCMPTPHTPEEGLRNIKTRCRSLGMTLKEFIVKYIPNNPSTFYEHIKYGQLRYTNILIVTKVLRLNPQDYMVDTIKIDEASAKRRVYRYVKKQHTNENIEDLGELLL
ncbi:hypothetical protein LCGC14_0337390 [marine sediment metagenome]|uniref:Uncharacterized protein n=1 Tax=marine sediment metagenome TaxID=412755 RepID=A0A0F9TXN1_9ZZZZ